MVFGTVPASNSSLAPPTAMYSLDSDPPFATTLALASNDIPNQPLFASNHILSSNAEHTLTINVTNAEAPFSVNNFFIFPTNRGNMTRNTKSSAGSQTRDRGLVGSSSEKTVQVLAGILGTIASLCIIGGIVYWLLRRRMTAKVRRKGSRIPALIQTSMRPGESFLPFQFEVFADASDDRHSVHVVYDHRYYYA